MKDLTSLMKQAQAMQEKLRDAQAMLAESEVDGAAGGGMVRVTLRGSGELTRLTIDETLLTPGNGDRGCSESGLSERPPDPSSDPLSRATFSRKGRRARGCAP